MRTGFMKKIVSAITIAGVALTGALTSAMAAETNAADMVKPDASDVVRWDADEVHYVTLTPHDGIDAYDESFMKNDEDITSVADLSYTEDYWLNGVTYVGYGSTLTMAVDPAYNGETLYAFPMVYALDDDGHIAYIVETSATMEDLSTTPKTIFQFDNINPMETIHGVNGHFAAVSGKIRPEKLLFVVEVYQGDMQEDRVGVWNLRIADNTNSSQSITAKPTASKVLVNGKEIAFDAYEINGNNYFKLRDISSVLNGTSKQFEVSWDNEKQAINLLSSKAYTAVGGELAKGDGSNKAATSNTSKIYLDGKEISLTAYTINGNNYFKLRDLGQTFNFGVGWDGAANTVTIDTGAGYTAE